MSFALDYLIQFPCIGIWIPNLNSLLLLCLFSFLVPQLQHQQIEVVKWYRISGRVESPDHADTSSVYESERLTHSEPPAAASEAALRRRRLRGRL